MPVRILIDACVLYPTVMREMVLGAARAGCFEPLWSARILEEWARAAVKIGPTGEAQARGEIALIKAAWPRAEVPAAPGIEQRLYLPDENDLHVLAAAIAGNAEILMTLNAKDFPRGTLAEEGVARVDPDSYLHSIWLARPEVMEATAKGVLAQAQALSGQNWEMRGLLKKARLPRLAKALG